MLVTISKPQVTLSNIDLSAGSQTGVGPNGPESSKNAATLAHSHRLEPGLFIF